MTIERTIETPLGPTIGTATDAGVTGLRFAEGGPDHRSPNAVLDHLERELSAYFAGDLRRFTVPVTPEGTDFERRVWDHLLTIPFGETRTYGEIARALGHAGASRAVGRANGANPVWLVIPCHRVIGSDGTLTGYAGGLERKRWLLDHEMGRAPLYTGACSSAG